MKKDITIILDELVECELKRGYQITLYPLTEMYKDARNDLFLSLARDYIWFDDYKNLSSVYANLSS